jgi:hypothetical protein
MARARNSTSLKRERFAGPVQQDHQRNRYPAKPKQILVAKRPARRITVMAQKKSKDRNAAALARKGAKKRVAAIPPERRKEIARRAAEARWKHKKG